MTANTPASRKAKGRRLQQAVRQDLVDRLGIDPGDILSTAMGQSGCDLYLSPAARERFPFAVECKAQEAIALPAWWRQCTRNAEAEGLAPLLILKQSRREALAVLRWEDLLALLSKVQNLREAAPEQVAPDWRPPPSPPQGKFSVLLHKTTV